MSFLFVIVRNRVIDQYLTDLNCVVPLCRDLLVCLDLKVLLDSVVLSVCLDKEEREASLACLDLL